MPKIVLNSQRNTDSILGITMLHTSWLDQPVLTTSDVKFKSLVVGDLIADGNIVLKGTVSEIETQHTLFRNPILDINADNLTPLLMGGLRIQRGPGLAPFNVLYNEDNKSLQIGFADSLNKVASKSEGTLTDGGVCVWNSQTNSIETPARIKNGVLMHDIHVDSMSLVSSFDTTVTLQLQSDNNVHLSASGVATGVVFISDIPIRVLRY
ncbi:hypothetical protein HDU81_010268 [Chytriomyces hyalinus]|nr:hypothetical protein HDU81_010268 [Chytriomyces hyalinus]